MKVNKIPEDETINKAKADELFKEHAILFGTRDAVPESIVIGLFGGKSAASVKSNYKNAGKFWNTYFYDGDYESTYITELGFYAACTFHNARATGCKIDPAGLLD